MEDVVLYLLPSFFVGCLIALPLFRLARSPERRIGMAVHAIGLLGAIVFGFHSMIGLQMAFHSSEEELSLDGLDDNTELAILASNVSEGLFNEAVLIAAGVAIVVLARRLGGDLDQRRA